jgi:hypothetical protein
VAEQPSLACFLLSGNQEAYMPANEWEQFFDGHAQTFMNKIFFAIRRSIAAADSGAII